MKKYHLLPMLIMVNLLAGCEKPTHIKTINSPTKGIVYTVETFNGHGPVSSDFTRVYAHLDHNGKSDKKLVLDGEYLEISEIRWISKTDVTICLDAGFTDAFHNKVTLIAGDSSQTIRNHLQEHCNVSLSPSPR
jgi:hypothetical protein